VGLSIWRGLENPLETVVTFTIPAGREEGSAKPYDAELIEQHATAAATAAFEQ
jgi:hypothetical protein